MKENNRVKVIKNKFRQYPEFNRYIGQTGTVVGFDEDIQWPIVVAFGNGEDCCCFAEDELELAEEE